MKKWMAIPALAGAVVIGSAAIIANADKGNQQPTGVLAAQVTGNDEQKKITVEQVEDKAVQTVDGGVVTEIDFDASDDEYEVEVQSGSVTYELDMKASTGEVVNKEIENIEPSKQLTVVTEDKKITEAKQSSEKKSNEVKSVEKTEVKSTERKPSEKKSERTSKYITAKEAIAIALKQTPGTVTDVELDDDDGRAYYEIEIEDGKYEYEYEIDAVTGKILDFEKDRDDD